MKIFLLLVILILMLLPSSSPTNSEQMIRKLVRHAQRGVVDIIQYINDKYGRGECLNKQFKATTNKMVSCMEGIVIHSLEIKGLCSILCIGKRKNIFHFVHLYFSPYQCPSVCQH